MTINECEIIKRWLESKRDDLKDVEPDNLIKTTIYILLLEINIDMAKARKEEENGKLH